MSWTDLYVEYISSYLELINFEVLGYSRIYINLADVYVQNLFMNIAYYWVASIILFQPFTHGFSFGTIIFVKFFETRATMETVYSRIKYTEIKSSHST